MTTTTATFAGQEGHTYYFRSRAQDNAGNWEDYPASDGDASTTIRDLTAPASAVAAIDTYASAGPSTHSFRVSWSGSDAVSGLASYDLQYMDGAGSTWTDWITQTTSTSAFFTGTVGHTYYFQSRARDMAGNVEPYPGGDGDAHTETVPPSSAIAALSPYQNSTSFAVYWSGTDASGIRSYDVQYKDGTGGTWTDWITGTAMISGTFSGLDGHTYYFQARARDVPGNLGTYRGGDGDAYTTVDTTLPSGTIWVNGGALATTSPSITVGLLANGASYMSFSNDSVNFTDWEAYGTSKQWVLAGDDGSKAVHVKFKDLASNVSAPYSTTVDLATALGQEAGISVNDGALYTNKVTVTLTLPAAPGTSKMMVSNEGDFKGAQWEPYAAYKAWAVTQYGAYVIPRFVYVKYKDLAGNVSSTSIDDIVLDVNAPTGSVAIEGTGGAAAAARAAAANVTLRLSASDDVSGVGGMMVSNSPAFSGASWEPFSASKTWSMESGGKVYVAFKDNAGNASPTYAAALSGAKESLPAVVLGTVHPKTGGAVASSETGTTVSFPPGAVGAKAEVTLVPAVEPSQQASTGALKSTGKFLTLTAKAGQTPVTTVGKAYTITVSYTAADVAGIDESTLGIYWWNGSRWQREPTSRVSTSARTVSATPDHLSAFAMLGEAWKVYLPLVIKSYGAGW